MTQGIYIIKFPNFKEVYIGESTNIEARIETHKYEMTTGSHANYKLIEAYNKYGPPTFTVLKEVLDPTLLKTIEAEYISEYDSYHNGLNLFEKSTRHSSHFTNAQLKKAFKWLASYKLHRHSWIEKHTGVDVGTLKLIEANKLFKFLHNEEPEKSKDISLMIEQREKKNQDFIKSRKLPEHKKRFSFFSTKPGHTRTGEY